MDYYLMEQKMQLLPDILEDEYNALKADIAAHGVLVPIEYDENGKILDGHHRVRACQELGITEWPSIVRAGMTDDEKVEHALALNLHRRHLTREQRQDLVKKLREQGWSLRRIADTLGINHETARAGVQVSKFRHLDTCAGADGKQYPASQSPAERERRREAVAELRRQGWSVRRIAETLGISIGTVHADIQALGLEDLPVAVNGADGKQYPVAKPAVFAKNNRERERAVDVLNQIDDGAPGQMMDLRTARRLAHEAMRKRAAEEAASLNLPHHGETWRVEVADMRDYQPGERFDFIITDPPYSRESLPLYETLARRAREWLKEDGLLVVMCGQSYLDQLFRILSEHLVYYWTAAYLTPGQPTPIRHRQVNCGWKPMLIYALTDNYNGKTFGDIFRSNAPEKDGHPWQQSVSGMLSVIAQLCQSGQSVFDPFCGAGTTGVAALQHGCRFVGIDIDEQAVQIARKRLYDTAMSK